MASVFVSLGSNLGDRMANIREALDRLGRLPKTRLMSFSSFYETAPVGVADQPDFINAAACLETDLSPSELIRAVLEIEHVMGRVRRTRWGAREIDIDLLLYDDMHVELDDLSIPHPRMHERVFVLMPLSEIAPDLVLADGQTVSESAARLAGSQRVRKIVEAPGGTLQI